MADLLTGEEIESRLGALEGWSRDGDVITKTFDHGDFLGSVEFVRRLSGPAEEMNHHSITNHSAGGLTEADFKLAARIDELG